MSKEYIQTLVSIGRVLHSQAEAEALRLKNTNTVLQERAERRGIQPHNLAFRRFETQKKNLEWFKASGNKKEDITYLAH